MFLLFASQRIASVCCIRISCLRCCKFNLKNSQLCIWDIFVCCLHPLLVPQWVREWHAGRGEVASVCPPPAWGTRPHSAGVRFRKRRQRSPLCHCQRRGNRGEFLPCVLRVEPGVRCMHACMRRAGAGAGRLSRWNGAIFRRQDLILDRAGGGWRCDRLILANLFCPDKQCCLKINHSTVMLWYGRWRNT